MKKTQQEIIVEQLQKHGKVSNVWAFQHYILRLGAIICDLRAGGMDIAGAYEVKKGKKTKNFVYSLK